MRALEELTPENAGTVLHFPDSIKATRLTRFALNWNPHGHEPQEVYSVPHFDYRFYLMSEQLRASITAGVYTTKEDDIVPNPPGVVPVACEVFDSAVKPVPADECASGYRMVPATVVPNMGVHMIDADMPEAGWYPTEFDPPRRLARRLLRHPRVVQAVRGFARFEHENGGQGPGPVRLPDTVRGRGQGGAAVRGSFRPMSFFSAR